MIKVKKNINLPRNIVVGRNILEDITKMTSDYKKKLVITGPITLKIAGNRVAKLLDCETLLVKKSNKEEVEKIKKYVKSNNIDLLVAVGGGKNIDVAKLAAYQTNIDHITVPTNCSNDGIASPIASLDNGYSKESIKAIPPMGVIADFDIIAESPYKFITAGIGDTIAKYSAVRDWKLSHIIKNEYYGDYASALSLMVAEVVTNSIKEIKEKNDIGIGILIEALISSGAAMGITGSSRPASGSEHKFSHALDMIKGTNGSLHGQQCGIGTIVMSYLQGEDWKKIKYALEAARCPTCIKELKLDRDVALEAMLKAREIRPQRYTIIEHVKLDRDIALNALETTEII